jgi:hypothetical protein
MTHSFLSRLLFLAALPVLAQTPDTAEIQGTVRDQSSALVGSAEITLTNALSGLKRVTHTNDSGTFSFAGLPVAGDYSIEAAKQGFAVASQSAITIAGGTSVTINIQLNVIGQKTSVEVTGTAGEVRPDEPQLGQYISSREANETPLLNRRITYLPLLNAANRPAISQGDVFMNEDLFTTNGAGRRQTWFEVDGATGNDSWGRQTIFSNVPLFAVQELTILENSFSAEYGGSTGSSVNIVTQSGSSTYHADALFDYRPAATGASLSGFSSTNASSGNDITSDKMNQFALDVSGPLNKTTQFFATGEYTIEDRPSPITSPIAPGSYVGQYRGWLGLIRLDHQLNDRNNIFLKSNADAFRDSNPNGIVGGNSLPSVARVFARRTYTEELGETATLTPTLVNNVRVQFQLASPITEFTPVINGTEFSVPISTGGTFTSGTSQSASLQNRQYEATDTLSAVWGRHQIKFGADSITAHTGGNSKEFGGPIYDGEFIYKTCTQPLSICESPAYLQNIANVASYTQSYGNALYTVNDTLWSAFVQDDIKVRTDLMVNLGLRYERQTFTNSNKNFAPRVGFAWNLNGNGTTVIRGGFGIYYSQIVDNSEANYALSGPTGVFNYSATPGQVGFPASVSAAPLPAFPAGAVAPVRSIYVRPGESSYLSQFFPTSTLIGYQNGLYSPYSEEWSFGVQQKFGHGWILSADYIGSHTIKINRPLDLDAPSPFIRTAPNQTRTAQAANCTRPYWIYWYAQEGLTCNPAKATNPQPPYSVIQSDVNDGYAYYDALNVNLNHRFTNRFVMLASYVWSHAIDNVDPDLPSQNPNDPNFTGKVENGNAIFDERQRFVLSGVYVGPWKITMGGVNTMGTGLPYNITTGTTNSGDTGATTDRPVINGVVVGRNTGHGRPIYDFSPFLERPFSLGERVTLLLRAEAFNAFNHANFVGYSGTYGNGTTAGAGFGQPLAGITNQLPARSMQFQVKLSF